MAKLFLITIVSALLFVSACAPVFIPVAPDPPRHPAWHHGHHHHPGPWAWRHGHGGHH